jgi:putative DNA-invertase from lambdoid prophage Rac
MRRTELRSFTGHVTQSCQFRRDRPKAVRQSNVFPPVHKRPYADTSGWGGENYVQKPVYDVSDSLYKEHGFWTGVHPMHTFAYLRVSTTGQTTDNQAVEIEAAGYSPDHTYADTISGKVPAAERPEFRAMLDTIARTRKPKRLIVSKLDRLGRDSVDIQATVRRLAEMGCAVRVLQLGDLDLTSSAGKLVMATLSAVAEMERDLLVERTKVGLARARRDGKALGRPRVTDAATNETIRERIAAGDAVAAIARDLSVSRQTVARVRDAG